MVSGLIVGILEIFFYSKISFSFLNIELSLNLHSIIYVEYMIFDQKRAYLVINALHIIFYEIEHSIIFLD